MPKNAHVPIATSAMRLATVFIGICTFASSEIFSVINRHLPLDELFQKLFLILALFALSACSVGQKCTYTQDGTKISSYVWFTKEVPIDLSKNNCN